MSGAQPDHEPAIQEFIQWVEETSSKGTVSPVSEVNTPFLPFPQLQRHFSDRPRMTKILNALLQDKAHFVDCDVVLQKYARVFSILLLIGKGRYIEHVIQYDSLCDDKLPFGKQRPENFPFETTDAQFFPRFYEEQWRFCAPELHKNMNKRFETQRILPIIHKRRLAEGGSAVLHKIILHEAYNKLYPSDINAPVMLSILKAAASQRLIRSRTEATSTQTLLSLKPIIPTRRGGTSKSRLTLLGGLVRQRSLV
jgi:hypothetical protein